MTIILDSTSYALFSVERDVVTFSDPASTGPLTFKRAAPKRTKDFAGMEKGEIKLTLVNPLTGATIGIASINTSILATAADVDRTHLIQMVRDAAAHASFTNLVNDRVLPLAG